jgi:hypothetical protein
MLIRGVGGGGLLLQILYIQVQHTCIKSLCVLKKKKKFYRKSQAYIQGIKGNDNNNCFTVINLRSGSGSIPTDVRQYTNRHENALVHVETNKINI